MTKEKNDFPGRLRVIFNDSSMAEIARRLDLPHATIRNYFGGRLPSPDVLIKIADATNVSLNWLLTGTGEMYVGAPRGIDIGYAIEQKIAEIIEMKLSGRGEVPAAFDVRKMIVEHGDPDRVLGAWFDFESRDYPKDFGVAFFKGWESFTEDERVDAVRDAKKVLDRALAAKE